MFMLLTPAHLPDVVSHPNELFNDLPAFIEALHQAPWLWARLGCASPHDYCVESAGDLYVTALPLRTTPPMKQAKATLRFEAVLHAKTHAEHQSPAFNAHIAISLWTQWYTPGYAGAPLISFYRKGEDQTFRLCIMQDIHNYLWSDLSDPEEPLE